MSEEIETIDPPREGAKSGEDGSRAPRRAARRAIAGHLAGQILTFLSEEPVEEGTHLRAQMLADRFNVSRSPVNEALKLLGDKGVLVYRRNRGFFCHERTVELARETRLADGDETTAAYFAMAEDRLDGTLGEHATESALRKRYSLNRTQFNEVMNRISREGWAEPRPGYGWSFSPVLMTPEALEQTYRLRLALEPAALREPGYALSPEASARCRTVEEWLLAGGIETASADELFERGIRFHEALMEASGNPFFLDALQRTNRIRRLLAYRAMADRSRYYSQARDHLRLLDLLDAGKTEEAAQAMTVHLTRVIKNLNDIRGLLETQRE